MGVLDFVKGMFTGVGRKHLKPGTRVVVHLDGEDVRGIVLQSKEGSRRKRVRVKLIGGGTVVAKKRNVTVD